MKRRLPRASLRKRRQVTFLERLRVLLARQISERKEELLIDDSVQFNHAILNRVPEFQFATEVVGHTDHNISH